MLPSTLRPQCHACALRQQIRHASLLRRPKRPYSFTQLITLSDGSTFTHRTTSPQPIYRSTKDTKNSALWNPSSQKLLNIEEDEAGRLKRFRRRFGRGFDAEAMEQGEEAGEGAETVDQAQQDESLLDLIAGYGQAAEKTGEAAGVQDEAKKSGKGKGGQK
ncbi:hypothetical protein LTR36_007515 [Oleoguttula mirabilis]|uniref:Ribosomal protein bL31m N-terminal domain-containing protein n=1 Tax=Oleoguttula mirabilis TaxID=1507867 RepID=A0AAV9JWR7_9PEZI|nr:hypothetical protein LTR36_007515 [Oleoguttula mirabilis]